ncbi:P-loop NTPase fold protein [Amycolatopsis sp. NPDC049868]|uniref:P-loop NTPase fold protein n=1 Tax=Amycolatopsis sp. NPDC049868 TaxID=3363934 RepID=UPI0037A95426
MTTPAQNPVRTIIVVDVVGTASPASRSFDRVELRRGVYDVLRTAFTESLLDFDEMVTEDRGDGVLILQPPGTPRSLVADQLPERLAVALRRYNHTRTPQAQIRLRMALNLGEVLNDGEGWFGEAIDTAFRILDAQSVKDTFLVSRNLIAVIASARYFDEVIANDPGLQPELYQRISMHVRTFSGTCYLRLVGEVYTQASQAVSMADGPVPELFPASALATLRSYLLLLDVPNLHALIRRALGPTIPVPSLDHITTPWNAVQFLADFNPGPDGIPPVIMFLGLLAEDLDGPTSAVIKEWVNEQAHRLHIEFTMESSLPGHATTPEQPVPGPPTPETKVDWASDAPALDDHLSRASLADVLAAQLRDVRGRAPSTSFLIHLDGAWGTGKSTLLNFLQLRLEDEFTIVRFDAWRQSRLGPPWWALLCATRGAVACERGAVSRAGLRVAEAVVRARRVGAGVTLSLFLLALLVAGLAVFLLPRIAGGDALATLAKAVTAVVATLVTLWAGARVVGRTLLWDTVRGARLFEQSTPNPMDQVAAHFDWMLGKARKPVVFFIDDLDRCPGSYVVDLLDAVQTLIRDTPTPTTTEHSAAYFVVAADGAWLRKSYEDAFPTFLGSVSTPGYSLGYLFMDKLFQLTVPVPMPSTRARTTYLGHLLNITDTHGDGDLDQEITAGKTALAGADDESQILEIFGAATPAARDQLARDAALALASPQNREHTEHSLRKFLPLLHPNPRNIKKFLNTYSILRSVRTLEQNTVPSDVLALWTIIRVRWPSIADHLETNPDAIRGLIEPLWASECLPVDLCDLATDPELRAVILHPHGGPLTADLVRQCAGTEWQ